jgi:mRNA interferase YafQ
VKYTVKPSAKFQKDLKRLQKRGLDMDLLTGVIKILAGGGTLPAKHRDHSLTGNFEGCRECHVQPDWLLIYEITENDLFLYLTRTGSHADLFR